MSNYIDYDQVNEDFKELHEFIIDELGVKTYREVMLLLRYTQRNVQPQQSTDENEADKIDYVG